MLDLEPAASAASRPGAAGWRQPGIRHRGEERASEPVEPPPVADEIASTPARRSAPRQLADQLVELLGRRRSAFESTTSSGSASRPLPCAASSARTVS